MSIDLASAWRLNYKFYCKTATTMTDNDNDEIDDEPSCSSGPIYLRKNRRQMVYPPMLP